MENTRQAVHLSRRLMAVRLGSKWLYKWMWLPIYQRLFCEMWKPGSIMRKGQKIISLRYDRLLVSHLCKSWSSGTQPGQSPHRAGLNTWWNLHLWRGTDILQGEEQAVVNATSYSSNKPLQAIPNGGWPDIIWIGWRGLNPLRITNTAAAFGISTTAQAILAAALQ